MFRLFRPPRALIALLLSCGMASTMAQNYPDKPIRLISPSTAGSPADVLARLLADSLSKVMNATIVVENRAGADQVIGLEYVAKGTPADGYTLALTGMDGQALLPLTKKDMRFNPIQDLTLVAGVGEGRYVLAGPASEPHKNFQALVKAVKAAPGQYNYGASGPAVRIPTMTLMKELGLNMEYVAFRGGGPYSIDLAAGRIHWGFLSETTAHTVKDRVRLYGVTGSTRSTANPEVPTFAEMGFPQIHGPAYGLAVRAGTPKAIVEKLSAAAATALQSTELMARAQVALLTIKYETAEQAKQTLEQRFRNYQPAAAAMGLKPE